MVKKKLFKQNIAIFLAILFHACGAIGILLTPYKNWFIQNTPINLGLMVLLLIWQQPKKNLNFFLFFGISFLIGMGVEMIGVNTGKLFGHYHYSNIMGEKLNGVPFLIGINWFVTIFCVGVLLTYISDWLEEKYMQMGAQLKPWTLVFFFVFDGALLATMLDYTMEPVATKLNFWKWKGDSIPDYNYLCWFVISALLFFLFKKMNFNKQNQFAIHLLIIQFLFFFTLKIYLQ